MSERDEHIAYLYREACVLNYKESRRLKRVSRGPFFRLACAIEEAFPKEVEAYTAGLLSTAHSEKGEG